MVVRQVDEVWATGGVASLLSLDILGAFNTVNYVRLLDCLRRAKIPQRMILFVRSFLQDRQTSLVLGKEESRPFEVKQGVLQGSPLSPILFLFYNASLLELLHKPV